jgi:hypothetical protein
VPTWGTKLVIAANKLALHAQIKNVKYTFNTNMIVGLIAISISLEYF